MPALPPADWHAALAEMDQAVGTALTVLDRYEERWRDAFDVRGPTLREDMLQKPSLAVGPRTETWDGRFAAAAELTEAVERDLAEDAAIVARWRESLERAVKLAEGEPCQESR